MNKLLIIINSWLLMISPYRADNIELQGGVPCYYQNFEIKNQSVLKKIEGYISKVEPDAIPIISLSNHGDSSFVYISAAISGNSIQKCPPFYLAKVSGRDVAVYKSGESPIQGECLNKLVEECRKSLQIDRMNAKNGDPVGEKVYYTYDPINAKILLIDNKIVSIDDGYLKVGRIPYYKTSF